MTVTTLTLLAFVGRDLPALSFFSARHIVSPLKRVELNQTVAKREKKGGFVKDRCFISGIICLFILLWSNWGTYFSWQKSKKNRFYPYTVHMKYLSRHPQGKTEIKKNHPWYPPGWFFYGFFSSCHNKWYCRRKWYYLLAWLTLFCFLWITSVLTEMVFSFDLNKYLWLTGMVLSLRSGCVPQTWTLKSLLFTWEWYPCGTNEL